MATAGYGHDQVQALIAQVKNLTVDKLKNILRSERLALSGIKSELQIRVIAHIEKLRNSGDQDALNRLRGQIRGVPLPYTSQPYPSPYSAHTPTSSASPPFPTPNSQQRSVFGMATSAPYQQNRLTFKSSPFYTILEPLSAVHECKAREATRDTARITVDLKPHQVDQLSKDPNCRVMVFCAAEQHPSAGFGDVDIAFPHNVELKCNSDEVKANLRGLKNKPGSTRPPDITALIRKKIAYRNNVEMVYALTTKKFYVVVNLVQKKTIDAMVSDIRRGRFITREQVLREMRSKADDPDIVATSTVMSLKDTIAYSRIQTPCRTVSCAHNQCFDAASYLQLQEQAPTWTCPICSKHAPWERLILDQYVNDILKAAPKNVDAVVIEPTGEWHVQMDNDKKANGGPTPSDDDDEDDDEDDLVEVQPGPPKYSGNTLDLPTFRTPPLSSREDSRAPSTSAPVPVSAPRSNKRTREDVIDLTLSDDEDQPAPKNPRTSFSSTSSDPLRSRPPDQPRYYFQLPPPPPGPPTYHTDRFSSGFHG